jgi:hypothetical protein
MSPNFARRFRPLIVAAALAACSSQREPAQRSIDDIDARVTAASAEAARYVPEQLMDVRDELRDLKTSFDGQDYAAVLLRAPVVMNDAQALTGAAAAKKAGLTKTLNEQWASLANLLPADITALQSRLDGLAKKSKRRLAEGSQVDAVQGALREDRGLWSKAQAAFATGNMDEAVTIGKNLQRRLEDLAGALPPMR